MAEFGRVAVITKATADEGCTTYAQGGVCAVLDPLDSVEKHVQDTMVAGAHLNNPGYFPFDCHCLCSPSPLGVQVHRILLVRLYLHALLHVHDCKPGFQGIVIACPHAMSYTASDFGVSVVCPCTHTAFHERK